MIELGTLLDVADAVAQDDVGVSMAPAKAFAAHSSARTTTIVTDASRAAADDGFGGFAFVPERAGEVFVMSLEWPAEMKAALDRAAQRRTDRAEPLPTMSMPAAETFAALALAAAVAERCDVAAVISVLDCAPAACAISSLYSPTAQIRVLLAACRRAADRWLGVHVPRTWNTDADRLSHPSLRPEVIADAERAGLAVVRVLPPAWVWDVAAAALALPTGSAVEEA